MVQLKNFRKKQIVTITKNKNNKYFHFIRKQVIPAEWSGKWKSKKQNGRKGNM